MNREFDRQAFDELMTVADRLHSADGCPWDRVQTFASLRPYVLEEAHEVLEAVDEAHVEKMVEELGDLLYTVIFYAKVAEREGCFRLADILEAERDKLVRRHPHVFGEIVARDALAVEQIWEARKKEEKAHEKRKHALDGIPATLPLLMRAQKVLKRIHKEAPELLQKAVEAEAWAGQLFALLQQASHQGVDVESELRSGLSRLEEAYVALLHK